MELADTPLPVELNEAPTTADACGAEPWTACDGAGGDVLLDCPGPTLETELVERLLLIELDDPPAMADGCEIGAVVAVALALALTLALAPT